MAGVFSAPTQSPLTQALYEPALSGTITDPRVKPEDDGQAKPKQSQKPSDHGAAYTKPLHSGSAPKPI